MISLCDFRITPNCADLIRSDLLEKNESCILLPSMRSSCLLIPHQILDTGTQEVHTGSFCLTILFSVATNSLASNLGESHLELSG